MKLTPLIKEGDLIAVIRPEDGLKAVERGHSIVSDTSLTEAQRVAALQGMLDEQDYTYVGLLGPNETILDDDGNVLEGQQLQTGDSFVSRKMLDWTPGAHTWVGPGHDFALRDWTLRINHGGAFLEVFLDVSAREVISATLVSFLERFDDYQGLAIELEFKGGLITLAPIDVEIEVALTVEGVTAKIRIPLSVARELVNALMPGRSKVRQAVVQDCLDCSTATSAERKSFSN